MRAGLVQGVAELGGELLSGGSPGRRDSHARGQGGEVERRPGQVQQAAGGRAVGGGSDPVQFHGQDGVTAVVENHRGDVQAFPGVRPQRRDRVHSAAVSFQRDDRTLRARDGGADG